MLVARADLTLDGPGVAVHVHGEGRVLVADVRGDLRSARIFLRNVPVLVRFARAASRMLRETGLRIELRTFGRTFGRLG